jgi:hypothetical protein
VFRDLDCLRDGKKFAVKSFWNLFRSLRFLLQTNDLCSKLAYSHDLDGIFGKGDQDFCNVIVKSL